MRIKVQKINIDIFSNQTLLELTDCLLQVIQIKITIQKDLNLKDITYQKLLSRLTTPSSMNQLL